MDALSSSVSSLIFPGQNPTSRSFYHFKAPNCYFLSSIDQNSHFNSCKQTTISTSPVRVANRRRQFRVPFVSSSSSKESSPKQFRASTTFQLESASSGYAAALVDMSRCSNSLKSVAKDVARLSNCLRNEQLSSFLFDPCIGEMGKGQVLMEVAEKGRFHRHLVVMLKLLVSKNKLGLVNDVLIEFQRMYDELTGTCVVVVSSERQMSKDILFGISQGIGKFAGAVKVKVKHVFDRRLPFLPA